MPVTINGSNTPTAGGVTYGDGTTYATTAAGTSGQVLTSAGAGAPTWTAQSSLSVGSATSATTATSATSATTATNLAGGAQGSVPYQSAAGTTALLAAGTSGQVLTTQGAGANPTWSTISSSPWVLLATVNASNSSTIDLAYYFSSAYDFYVVLYDNVLGASNGSICARIMDNTGSWMTSSYAYTVAYMQPGTGITSTGSTNNSSMIISRPIGANSSYARASGLIYINGPLNTSNYKNIYWTAASDSGGNGTVNTTWGAGAYIGNSGTIWNGIQLFNDGGNITSGKFSLYGVKQ